MSDTLILRPLPVMDTLQFVVAVVRHRLELCIPEALLQASPKVTWPWTLARGVRNSLVNALAESMCSQLLHSSSIDWKSLSSRDSEWSTSLAFIIWLTNPNEIPSAVPRLIRTLYNGTGQSCYDLCWPVRSLLLLARSLELFSVEEATHCLILVVYASFIDPTKRSDGRSYERLLARARYHKTSYQYHYDTLHPTQEIVALLEAARVILHRYIREQTESRDSLPPHIEELLRFVLDGMPFLQDRLSVDIEAPLYPTLDESSLIHLLADLSTTPHTIHSLLDFLVHNPQYLLGADEYPNWSFSLAMWEVSCSHENLTLLWSNCASFFSKAAVSPTKPNTLVLLHVCRLVFAGRVPKEFVPASHHTCDPRRQRDGGGLPDKPEMSSPLLGFVDRALEGEVKEPRYTPTQVYQAIEDAIRPTPIRSMTTEEAAAGSSETMFTLPGQLLVREADQSFTSDGPMASRAGNPTQGQAVLSAQSVERGEDIRVNVEEIPVVLPPSSSRPLES
ncbi:hypothetical protein EIP86_011318 [Pleurotus ostreatoroseus]|nr:hypothetical protein EIP86_011318 [Pleurotus ostreatoroseus]